MIMSTTTTTTDLELQEVRLIIRPIKLDHDDERQFDGDRDEEEEEEEEEETCRTPTSSEHKIPVTENCPPAPRKRRPSPTILCKRRLSDQLQFFEVVGRDEINEFFGNSSSSSRLVDVWSSTNGAISGSNNNSAPRNIKKRRCTNYYK